VKISVIIPTFNRLGVLPRAINSVLSQSAPAHEIIVVDDGSEDDSATFVREQYPTVKLIKQEQRGVSSARNAGIAHATGDWIALLDSDDEWLENKLKQQQSAMLNDHSHRICHCDEIWIRNGVRVNPKKKHKKKGGWIYLDCLPLCAISPSAVLIHKDVFYDYGTFDESLPACEDYDLWLRICAHEPVLFVDELLLKKYGGHSDQLSQKHWGMDRFRMIALAKSIASGKLNQHALAQTREQLASKLQIFIAGAKKRGKHSEAEEAEKRYQPLISVHHHD